MAVSEETRARVNEHFPAFAWLLNEPELAEVLQRAVDQEWTADTFEANLRSTQWWRTRSDTQRTRADIEMTDPTTADAQVRSVMDKIRVSLGELGGEMDHDTIAHWAWTAWRGGWTETQLRAQVASLVSPSAGAMMNVRALASAYMIDLPDAQAMDLTRRVHSGELTQQAVETLLANQSSSRFPQLAEWIKQGVRPAEYFAPYRQMIADMTGVTADSVDLSKDPTWSRVVSYADGTTLRPMTLDEATRYVRSTDQFMGSARGQAEQASFVKAFAQSVGAIAG